MVNGYASFGEMREENQRTQKKHSEQGENQEETQPIYVREPESSPGHIYSDGEVSALLSAPSLPPLLSP